MLRGLKQNLIHTRRTLRDGARCAFECLNVSYRGTGHSGLPQGQGLWVQQTWVWLRSLLEEVSNKPTIESPVLTQDW